MLIWEQRYSKHKCMQCFGMQSGLNPSGPLQQKIRISFMNKDVWASSPFCVQCALVTGTIIYSPTKACSGESESHGGIGSGATATYSRKDIPPHPHRTSCRKWTHKSSSKLSVGLCLLISRGLLLFLHTPLRLFYCMTNATPQLFCPCMCVSLSHTLW